MPTSSTPNKKAPREKKSAKKEKDPLEEILVRGTATFIDPEKSFTKKLRENPSSVVIKFGADPTRPDIHLGHAVVLRKLREFQDLGAKVVFVVGDFTTGIGDPTGKSKVRKEVSAEEIERNMKTYVEQVGKVIRTDPAVFSWIRNSDWYANVTDVSAKPGSTVSLGVKKNGAEDKITFDANSFVGKALLFEQTRMQGKTGFLHQGIATVTIRTLLSTLRSITHSRLIERDMFMERLQKGEELYMHEMLYPVIQAIDSSVIASIYGSCDLEIGGTDQTFNMLMGRDVMRNNGQEPQAVMCMELIVGTDGKEKMSKSLDNYIALEDSPEEMYGKTMSIPDSLIVKYLELTTYTPLAEIQKVEKAMSSGKVNPKDAKMFLARQIVSQYHGESAADSAEQKFVSTFSKGETPDPSDKVSFYAGEPIGKKLVLAGLIASNTEWRRLVSSGAVEDLSNNSRIDDPEVVFSGETIIRVGKKRFVSLIEE